MLRLQREAIAGFDEKNDALVTVRPIDSGITIALTSKVERQYGAHNRALIEEVVRTAGVNGVHVEVKDNAAWDYTLIARVRAALERGMR